MADRRISDFPTLQQALDTDLILVDSQSSTYNISFATLKAATKGAPGTGIASYQDYYARNNSTTAPADSSFSTTVISPTSTYRYLWGYTKILYSDETELVTNKHILAVYGDKGTNLSGITTYFLAHADKTGVTRSTSGWSTTVPELTTAKPYMWSYQRLGLSDGSYQYTTPGVIGSIGQQGPQGESAYSIAVEHGYSGTEAQWEQDMANAGTNAGIASQKAQEAATSASNAASAAQSAVNSALTNYYNKTSVDNLLSNKADTSTVNTQLATKANSADVYTKQEINAFDYISNGTEDDVELRGDLAVSGNVSLGGNVAVPLEGLLKVVRITLLSSVSIAANNNNSSTYTITTSDIGAGWTPVGVVGYSMGQGTWNVYRLRISPDSVNTLEYSVRNMDSSAHTGSLGCMVLCIRTSL